MSHFINANRQPNESPREFEEQFRLLVETVTDYEIFRLAPDGTVATWIGGAERFKRYRAATEERYEKEVWRVRSGSSPDRSSCLGFQGLSPLVEQLDGQLEIVREQGTALRIQFPKKAP